MNLIDEAEYVEWLKDIGFRGGCNRINNMLRDPNNTIDEIIIILQKEYDYRNELIGWNKDRVIELDAHVDALNKCGFVVEGNKVLMLGG